ncbi:MULTISPECIES: hypothetical protein [Pseudophaeobacter]|jgi:FlaG/FlaF family flagellin (archaellin)|uniref:hypothetical protein n=1 Tax=Pseudophaeobacter TaxID=1541822 RepID=UPI002431BB84|nr:hypothetical protein [Pseudophaeobacter profundi]
MKKFWLFIASDDGAVTVDWVVMTAVVVLLAAIIYTMMPTAISTVAENTQIYLESIDFF